MGCLLTRFIGRDPAIGELALVGEASVGRDEEDIVSRRGLGLGMHVAIGIWSSRAHSISRERTALELTRGLVLILHCRMSDNQAMICALPLPCASKLAPLLICFVVEDGPFGDVFHFLHVRAEAVDLGVGSLHRVFAQG